MVVGLGHDPTIGEYERLLLSTKTTARKELVLLHPERSVIPGTTREWLKVGRSFKSHLSTVLMKFRSPGLGFMRIFTSSFRYLIDPSQSFSRQC